MATAGKLSFCQRLVYLNRRLISFAGRPYLPAIYASSARNLVLRWPLWRSVALSSGSG